MTETKERVYIIDCDAAPFVPSGWKGVEQHQTGGSFAWDPKAVEFYRSKFQQHGKHIRGEKLRDELRDKPVLNANVLDYLLAHPHLIPEEWKHDEQGRTRYIFFWGTIYRGSAGSACVRYLSWDGGRWLWYYFWLGIGWSDYDPAALRSS
jgi:hypothetical protein